MTEPAAEAPRIRPRQSLSGRLWLLATLAVLLSEIVVFLPYVAHERSNWLIGRVEDASIATLAADGSSLDPARRDELLRLTGTQAIRLLGEDGSIRTVGDVGVPTDAAIDLRQEHLFSRIGRALSALILEDRRLIRLTAEGTHRRAREVQIVLHEPGLSRALRQFARDFAGLALLIAGVTGGLVYLAVLVLLVRPMRHITHSIVAFRSDPEHTMPLDPDNVTVLPNDEMAVAGRELAAMQHELRAALWRNARLAALGTVVAKVSHDLRGILTPALLSAERLMLNQDAKVRRAGETLVQAVDRATELVKRTLDYAREGPPPLDLTPVELAAIIDEAAEAARPPGSAFRLDNAVGPAILVRADRIQLYRVLVNLLRNAAEAGAHGARATAHHASPTVVIEIADDGPGLPEKIRAELFRPFAGSTRRGGSGLGLAIARDLMVAHGGGIELVETDSGTTFRLTLRAADQAAPQAPQASAPPAAAAEAGRSVPATSADV
jgi:signal transduction histidine kinase